MSWEPMQKLAQRYQAAGRGQPGSFGVKSAATAFYVRAQARGHCRCSRSDAANLAAGWVVDHFT